MSATIRGPPSPHAGWKSIRPWNRLTLHVREITPVSATFILSSSLALRVWDDAEDLEEPDNAGPSQPAKPPMKPLSMSELLRKGLAVKVNSAPWQKVVMHIDDDTDMEAIVILYGLLPACQYDIELALVAGEETIRGKIITEDHSVVVDTNEVAAVHEELNDDVPILPSLPIVGQPLTPAATRPPSPVSSESPRTITVEERASQLLRELTALDEEKESLALRLKVARRESQKADTALRQEIEALKRASDRSAQMDLRTRQKILALQEATKQLLAASVDADEQVKLVEKSLPQLEERSKAAELEYHQVIAAAGKDHAIASDTMKRDRKQIGEMEGELLVLTNRLDKLNTKKDKLMIETVPELEERLASLGKEIEEAERAGIQTPPQTEDHHISLSPGQLLPP